MIGPQELNKKRLADVKVRVQFVTRPEFLVVKGPPYPRDGWGDPKQSGLLSLLAVAYAFRYNGLSSNLPPLIVLSGVVENAEMVFAYNHLEMASVVLRFRWG